MANKTSKKSAKPIKKTVKRSAKAAPPRRQAPPAQDGVVLLSGGNPQIAKGYGDEPVQAYLAATHDGQVAEPVQRAGGREQTGESE